MSENKPVELADDQLDGVSGGGGSYVWDKTYQEFAGGARARAGDSKS